MYIQLLKQYIQELKESNLNNHQSTEYRLGAQVMANDILNYINELTQNTDAIEGLFEIPQFKGTLDNLNNILEPYAGKKFTS